MSHSQNYLYGHMSQCATCVNQEGPASHPNRCSKVRWDGHRRAWPEVLDDEGVKVCKDYEADIAKAQSLALQAAVDDRGQAKYLTIAGAHDEAIQKIEDESIGDAISNKVVGEMVLGAGLAHMAAEIVVDEKRGPASVTHYVGLD